VSVKQLLERRESELQVEKQWKVDRWSSAHSAYHKKARRTSVDFFTVKKLAPSDVGKKWYLDYHFFWRKTW
jgi:hypothetical protein